MKIRTGIHWFMLVLNGIIWTVVFLVSLLLVILALQSETVWQDLGFALSLCGGFTFVIYRDMQFFSEVILEDEGVFVRVLFRKRFYSWREIKQAGVLFHPGRGVPYERLYLLKPNGSRRCYRDKGFLMRNIGRVIQLPADEEIRTYVTEHYGPLDFDLSYGKTEQSQVVDMEQMGGACGEEMESGYWQ